MSGSYTAARVHAMRATLLQPQDYERLMKMTEREIIGFLQSSAYRPDVDAITLKDLDDLEVIDKIIAHNEERTITKLKRVSSGEFNAGIGVFLRRNDAWNLRLIAESIVGGNSPEDAIKRYAKRGTFDPSPYAKAKTIGELARLASRKVPTLRRNPTTLATFFDALDAAVREDKQMAKHPALIDEKNIVKLIMLKRDKLAPAAITTRMIRGGDVGMSTLRAAANAEDVSAALKILRATPYSAVMERADPKELVRFEYELHHEIVRRMRRSAGRYPLGQVVLIRYLSEKDIEAENLRLVIKGKRLGMTENFIREQIII